MSNPFDPGMLGGLGAMLGNLPQKLEAMKRRNAETRVEGSAGGGLVVVQMTGELEVDSVRIDPKAMDDRELLEDLVRAAVSDATQKARAEMARGMSDLTGGLPIPPGLLGF